MVAQAAKYRDEIRRALVLVENDGLIAQYGCRIEDKGITFTIHFRNSPRPAHAERYLETQIAPQLDRAGLAWSIGRMVFEVRPPVAVDKGTAVKRLRGRRRIDHLLYAGDDRTDLDAFREATDPDRRPLERGPARAVRGGRRLRRRPGRRGGDPARRWRRGMTQDPEQRYREESKRRFERIKSRTRYNRNLLLCADPRRRPGHRPGGGLAGARADRRGRRRHRRRGVLPLAPVVAGDRRGRARGDERVGGGARVDVRARAGRAGRRRVLPRPREARLQARVLGSDGGAARSDRQLHLLDLRDADARRGNGSTETYREEVKHKHTVLRLELGDLGLHSLQLSPQGLGGGMFEKLRSTFTGSRSVNLESSEFNGRYTLLVEDAADDVIVRRIFEPAFIVRCVEGRFPMATFQYERPALAFIWSDQYDVTELRGGRAPDRRRVADGRGADGDPRSGWRPSSTALEQRLQLGPLTGVDDVRGGGPSAPRVHHAEPHRLQPRDAVGVRVDRQLRARLDRPAGRGRRRGRAGRAAR